MPTKGLIRELQRQYPGISVLSVFPNVNNREPSSSFPDFPCLTLLPFPTKNVDILHSVRSTRDRLSGWQCPSGMVIYNHSDVYNLFLSAFLQLIISCINKTFMCSSDIDCVIKLYLYNTVTYH